jgi:hypothetical protein
MPMPGEEACFVRSTDVELEARLETVLNFGMGINCTVRIAGAEGEVR